jgi:crotonobetainyl-CoA:carnitine CoA-transferase CaiB-like acyl-CoA transferase
MPAATIRQPQPLRGVKIIELGTLSAGPYAGGVFAQFGADVIKVETPGDGGVRAPPFELGIHAPAVLLVLARTKGKRHQRRLAVA